MPTPLFDPGASDVLYIIDLSGYVFRAYHAITPLTSPDGEPTQAIFGTVNMLEKLVRQRRPAMLAVAMDSSKPTFRKEVYPEYKGHRPPPPPDLPAQMRRCREIVDAFAIPVFQKDGFEADDLIACAVAQARDHGLRVVIVSADKDLMQLVGEDVVLWDTMRDKVFGVAEVEERFGVPVSAVRDWLALTGDSSDNIPGVPSVGPKTATELLSRFGNLDQLFSNLERVERKGLRDKLRLHEADARLSRELVTLRNDVPVTFDPSALKYGGRDIPTLRRLYRELGFAKHLSALDADQQVLPLPEPTKVEAPSVAENRLVLDVPSLNGLVEDLGHAGRFALLVETSVASPMRGIVVGVSFSIDGARAAYLPLGHRYVGAPTQVDRSVALRLLAPLLEDVGIRKVVHDGKRAQVALGRAGISLRGIEFDTQIAGYLLDSELPNDLGALAARELGVGLTEPSALVPKERGAESSFEQALVEPSCQVLCARARAVLDLSSKLVGKLSDERLVDVFEKIELPLATQLAEMEANGVLVDGDRLRALGRRIDQDLEALEREAHRIAGRVFNVNSPRQLETLLFDEIGLRHLKRTKTSRSTDADTLESLSEHHELPKVILEIRQLSKLKGTYVDTLPTLTNPETKRIHTRWEQTVAATGRLSSSDPNLQNIPIRSALGREIRSAFVAPPGHELVSADYSQIELRVLAHLSKDPVLVDSFRSGQDVHTRTAMEVFGARAGEVTDEMRRRAKAVNFGVVYGQGDSGLAKSLGIPRHEAAAFIAAYFRRYEGVRRFMNDVLESARVAGSVRTLFGRRRLVPEIRSENRARRLAAERVAMNTPIQGTAADLLKLAMLSFRDPPTPGARMVLTVHDELVFEVPHAEVERATACIRERMEGVHPLEVPLVVDVGHGADWSSAH